MNLVQLEMAAKALYPEQFGAWPTYEGGAYPDSRTKGSCSTVSTSQMTSTASSD